MRRAGRSSAAISPASWRGPRSAASVIRRPRDGRRKLMGDITRRAAVIGMTAAGGLAAAGGARGAATLALTLGTATPGGGFPLYGGAVVETVHAVDPGLT